MMMIGLSYSIIDSYSFTHLYILVNIYSNIQPMTLYHGNRRIINVRKIGQFHMGQ